METLKNPTETKAKKEHKCSFCNERIRIGEKYMKSTHIFDGRVYDWKSHKNCSYLSKRLNMYSDCIDGVTQDDFIEIVSEYHYSIFVDKFSNNERAKFEDVLHQLKRVNFKDKLDYVFRHYKKIDLNNE